MKEAKEKFHPANIDIMLEAMKRNRHLSHGAEKHQIAANDICFVSTFGKQSFSKEDRLLFFVAHLPQEPFTGNKKTDVCPRIFSAHRVLQYLFKTVVLGKVRSADIFLL